EGEKGHVGGNFSPEIRVFEADFLGADPPKIRKTAFLKRFSSAKPSSDPPGPRTPPRAPFLPKREKRGTWGVSFLPSNFVMTIGFEAFLLVKTLPTSRTRHSLKF
ncbi:MAG: hypothetical protein Q7T55_08050, partial [Solirubrobacteraceae bacterium]|nr:hypothetical protein [Solirubrobacteraceae bacterium]